MITRLIENATVFKTAVGSWIHLQLIKRNIQSRFCLAVLALSLLLLLQFGSFVTKAVKIRDTAREPSRYQYPFQNPEFSIEERIKNILSLMTLDEKVACLGTNPSVPRLGIKGTNHVEGIHGLAQGGPAKWGRPNTIPTTTFPQGMGLGETWDPDILRQEGASTW